MFWQLQPASRGVSRCFNSTQSICHLFFRLYDRILTPFEDGSRHLECSIAVNTELSDDDGSELSDDIVSLDIDIDALASSFSALRSIGLMDDEDDEEEAEAEAESEEAEEEDVKEDWDLCEVDQQQQPPPPPLASSSTTNLVLSCTLVLRIVCLEGSFVLSGKEFCFTPRPEPPSPSLPYECPTLHTHRQRANVTRRFPLTHIHSVQRRR